MKKDLGSLIIPLVIFVFSCVPKSDYESLLSENNKLKQELNEYKFGAKKLLKQAQLNFNQKFYDQCLQNISELEKRHPESNEYNQALELRKRAVSEKQKQIEETKKVEAEHIRKEEERISVAKKVEAQRLANATSKMRKEYDDVNEFTWYYDKTSPQYVNSRTCFFAYIGKGGNSAPFLRLAIYYVADDWLFIKSYTIKVEDKTYDITEDGYGEIKKDNGTGGIWEWLDRKAGKNEYEIIKAVANGNNVKIRFSGKDYYKDRVISSSEKQALKNVLDAYEALGGSQIF
jgi:hypothetical protein